MPLLSFKLITDANSTLRRVGGFGLIELLVTISIVLLVTTIILSRHSAFNSVVLLRNQAYQIAFSVREVQQRAVSVAVSSDGELRSTYGIHFEKDSREFFTFRDDLPNNYFYAATERFGPTNILDPRFVISDIKTFVGANEIDRDELSVTFERPNFDAIYAVSDSGGKITVDRAEITISLVSDSTSQRIVEVTNTGQISVKSLP